MTLVQQQCRALIPLFQQNHLDITWIFGPLVLEPAAGFSYCVILPQMLARTRGRFEHVLWEKSPNHNRPWPTGPSEGSGSRSRSSICSRAGHRVWSQREAGGQSRQLEKVACSSENQIPVNQHVSSNGFFQAMFLLKSDKKGSHNSTVFELCLLIYRQRSRSLICCRATIAIATAWPRHRLLRLEQEHLPDTQSQSNRNAFWKGRWWVKKPSNWKVKRKFLPALPFRNGRRRSDEQPSCLVWAGGWAAALRGCWGCLPHNPISSSAKVNT